MRRCLGLVLFLVVLAMGVQAADVTAVRAPKGMRIDGNLEEWSRARPLSIDGLGFYAKGDPGSWKGPGDLGAVLYVMWDDEYLYFAAQVTDDVVIQDNSGQYLFAGDTLEVYLSIDGQHLSRTSYSRADFQFGFSPGTDANAPDWHLWTNPTQIYDVEVAAVRTQTGYILEVALGLDQLGLFPDTGLEIGFDIGVNDLDSHGKTAPDLQLNLSRSGDGWRNPSVFGWLLFLD